MDLSYTYDVVNVLTVIADADDSDYLCTATCDANGNITELYEMDKPGETSLADFMDRGSRAGTPVLHDWTIWHHAHLRPLMRMIHDGGV